MRLTTIGLFVFTLLNFPQPQVGLTVAQTLPSGVLMALADDEREYCERFLGSYKKGCGETFRANLAWRDLEITPGGQVAILVENKTSCGIAGCALYLFVQQKSGNFTQVLGADGGLGTLKRVAVLKKIRNGHYDIRVTWSDGKSYSDYQWDGWHYSTDDRDFWGTGSKMSGKPTYPCDVSQLPLEVQNRIKMDFSTWRVQALENLSQQARSTWAGKKNSGCPGIAVGLFQGPKQTSFAVLLVPSDHPDAAYRFVSFNRAKDNSAYEELVVEKSDERGASNFFIQTVAVSKFFNDASKRKFEVQVTDAILMVDSAEDEYEADIYFWSKNRFRQEPVDY